MIPPELSNGIISLDENGEKKVVTLQIDLDQEANVKKYSFYESDFINLNRYDYQSF
jgi:exoribonuclease R